MRNRNTLRRLSLALAAVAACGLYSWSPAAAAAGDSDEASIRESVRRLEAGWNAKSGAKFAEPFAADVDYVVINGSHVKGREAIAEGHQQIFDTVFKESVLSLSVEQLRMLRPDVAVVHVNGTNRFRRGAETHAVEALITLVLTKESGAWKVAALQITEKAAPGR